ncbi:uncharacterized protein LOC116940923 [Petromyzon marinus]|uniref:uncharacterized protein LOC116940923 n=1 Tax=Petromyzon marinus TaxID=7757 RepID=UPI0001627763
MLLPLLKNGAPFRGLKLLAALGGLCLLQATLGVAESRRPQPSPLYIRGREVNPLWYVGRGVRPIGRFGKRQTPWFSDAPAVRIQQQETAWPDASPARRGLWLVEGATGALLGRSEAARRGTLSPTGLAASRFGSGLRMKRLG